MATYKGIQGRSVQSLSSDPSSIEDSRGQIWYNSTTGVYKMVADYGGYTVKTITDS